MAEQKKDEGVGDTFKILLEESLKQQRNAMMDKFAQILRQHPTCDTSSLVDTLEAPLFLRYKLTLTFPYLKAR